MYEIRLKKEFKLNRMLQNSEVKDYIKIYYKERNGRDPQWKSILTEPSSELYPNNYKVTYRFPKMYVGPDKYVRNWEKSFYCLVDEQTLMSPSRPFTLQIEGGCFSDGELPFCPHTNKYNICTGSASSVAKNFGVYYFFALVGMILNMDKSIVDTESGHYNPEALYWWREKRQYQPNNNIKWPLDLNERLSRQIRNNPEEPSRPTIRFGKQTSPTIRFGQVSYPSSGLPVRIKIGNKQ